jgi:hypothetical protein
MRRPEIVGLGPGTGIEQSKSLPQAGESTKTGSWMVGIFFLVFLLSAPGCGGADQPGADQAAEPDNGAGAATDSAPAEAAPSQPTEAPAATSSTQQLQLTDVILTPAARIQAEKFDCICGCNLRLAKCFCEKTPGSIDMKQHLQSLVDADLSPSQIKEGMVLKYGEAVNPQ